MTNIHYITISIVVAAALIYAIYKVIKGFYRRKYINSNFPGVVKMKKGESCTERNQSHTWKTVKLAILKSDIPFQETNICTKCGMIEGKDQRLNQAGIESLREQIETKDQDEIVKDVYEKLKVELNQAFNDFINTEEPDITDEYLKNLFMHGVKSAQKISDKLNADIKLARQTKKVQDILKQIKSENKE